MERNITQSFPVANPLEKKAVVVPVALACVVRRKKIGCRQVVNDVAER